VSKVATWEELHGQWPAVIVQQLRKHLPTGYVCGPRVHSGSQIEVDVAAYERDDAPAGFDSSDGGGGVATAVWAPPQPAVAVEIELPDYDEYEVRIYDATRERTLVAAIELVSLANKDRAEHRNAFVGKCAALLQKGVAVTIVDVVTARHNNLYAELLAFLGLPDTTFGAEPPATYAASCRWVRAEKRAILQTWPRALAVGQPLPVLPLWLTATFAVPLDLEQSYEKACDDLSIA
jgi:hypothetical protein